MDLLIKIKENSLEREIINLIRYLKKQSCVKKLDVRSDDLIQIQSISDKETISTLHITSSNALADFLENEKDPIF